MMPEIKVKGHVKKRYMRMLEKVQYLEAIKELHKDSPALEEPECKPGPVKLEEDDDLVLKLKFLYGEEKGKEEDKVDKVIQKRVKQWNDKPKIKPKLKVQKLFSTHVPPERAHLLPYSIDQKMEEPEIKPQSIFSIDVAPERVHKVPYVYTKNIHTNFTEC